MWELPLTDEEFTKIASLGFDDFLSLTPDSDEPFPQLDLSDLNTHTRVVSAVDPLCAKTYARSAALAASFTIMECPPSPVKAHMHLGEHKKYSITAPYDSHMPTESWVSIVEPILEAAISVDTTNKDRGGDVLNSTMPSLIDALYIDRNWLATTFQMSLTKRADEMVLVEPSVDERSVIKGVCGEIAVMTTFEELNVPVILPFEMVHPVILYRMGIKLAPGDGSTGLVIPINLTGKIRVGGHISEYLFGRSADSMEDNVVTKKRRMCSGMLEVSTPMSLPGIMRVLFEARRDEARLPEILASLNSLTFTPGFDQSLIDAFKIVVCTSDGALRTAIISELYTNLQANDFKGAIAWMTCGAHDLIGYHMFQFF